MIHLHGIRIILIAWYLAFFVRAGDEANYTPYQKSVCVHVIMSVESENS